MDTRLQVENPVKSVKLVPLLADVSASQVRSKALAQPEKDWISTLSRPKKCLGGRCEHVVPSAVRIGFALGVAHGTESAWGCDARCGLGRGVVRFGHLRRQSAGQ
jgi:hypothetical protein